MNALSVQHLGKKFKLFPSPGSRFLEYLSAGTLVRHTDFWALRDITFEIPAGTTLGILGQNGSGKSTLLSILAGVLEPSAGTFSISGKVSAILELGSGFHPEFSGRDNVYMYGAIMGLSREKIDERFDEIVRFSELGDFIDQPLRTYSSGMIVRLAFSVAVNVNADILIVDEALAVGDAIFQHRCFRKIREMQEAGKTILYVGHDTEAVRNICTSALLLDSGRIIERGDPNMVVNKYHALIAERERTYSEGNLIEHGEVPRKDHETVFDFIRNLKEAKVVNAEAAPVKVQTIEIQSVPRSVLFAHPPSQITYSVTIEPGASLAFAIGILPYAWEKIAQGVKYDIEIACDGVTENIFSRVLQPKRNTGDRGWHNFIIPLEKYAGEKIIIILSTTASGDDLRYCWSAWGWMKIIQSSRDSIASSSEVFKEIRYGSKKAEIIFVDMLDNQGLSKRVFRSGELVQIVLQVLLHEKIESNLAIGFLINNNFGIVYGTNTRLLGKHFDPMAAGEIIKLKFSQFLNLGKGIYSLTIGTSVASSDNIFEIIDRRNDVITFKIDSKNTFIGCVDLNTKIEENL